MGFVYGDTHPCFYHFLFSSMFYAGKAEHLPIAIIDQDQSELSRNIGKYLSLNHTVDIKQLLQAQVKPRDYSMKPKYGVMFLFRMVPKNVL